MSRSANRTKPTIKIEVKTIDWETTKLWDSIKEGKYRAELADEIEDKDVIRIDDIDHFMKVLQN